MTEEGLEQLITELVDDDVGKLIERRMTMIDLYCEYCKELAKYDPGIYTTGADRQAFIRYMNTEGFVLREINKDGKHVGFLMTVVKKDDKDTLIIAEAYVIPEYRKHGYMREAVKDALKGNYKMIRYMAFDGNPARKFWVKMLWEAGYKCVAQEEVSECLQEYFYVKAV